MKSRRGRPAGKTGAALLHVARAVFLERGFAGTSMEEVAVRAKISKSSLYREHASKDALFESVVLDWAAGGRDATQPALDDLAGSVDVRAGLIEWASKLRAGVLDESVVAMRRLVISEAPAHPDIAAKYLDQSWNTNISRLADVLTSLTEAGRLDVRAPMTAAEHLVWLIVGSPLNAILLGVPSRPSREGVENAVDLFLAQHGVRQRTQVD